MIGSAPARAQPSRSTADSARDGDRLDHRVDDRRAFSRFAEHIALSGVSVKDGKRVIYAGWDRQRGRRVRVIVEELED